MRNIFKKTTQNNKQSDYVLRRPRYSGDPSSEFFRLDSGLRRNDRSRAFTLVETLVAISILMLSVSGPLYYASESLKAAIYARDQITAFYIAQDAFEQIRKIRDNNTYFLGSTYSWNNGLIGCEDDIVAKCVIAKSPSLLYTLSPGIDEADTFLYRDANGLYSHDTGGTKTIFKRMIKIEPTNGDPILTDWPKATEMKVTVLIKWNSRGTDRNFTAYEFLRNFKD
jgi:type II secretory pathway pseudopilin PulG